jgi:hypothetical protein
MNKNFLKWNEINFIWSEIKRSDDDFMLWSEIYLIDEVLQIVKRGGSDFYNDPWRKISKEIGKRKTEKFIKIFCTVNDIEYVKGKFIKEDSIKVDVDKFEKVFKKVNIKVNI